MARKFILVLSIFLPWRLKRLLLTSTLGFTIPRSARIGISWIDATRLVMGEHSLIGHFNVFKRLDLIELGDHSVIANFNLVTCVPTSDGRHYRHIPNRVTELRLGRHSSVTMRHLIDCNASVVIGDFTTIGGYSSQLLTHSVDVYACRQDARPITIGSYCFVGTACTILGGARLPDYSVLAAASCLRDAFTDDRCLYAGVPATMKKALPETTGFWSREGGWVA